MGTPRMFQLQITIDFTAQDEDAVSKFRNEVTMLFYDSKIHTIPGCLDYEVDDVGTVLSQEWFDTPETPE